MTRAPFLLAPFRASMALTVLRLSPERGQSPAVPAVSTPERYLIKAVLNAPISADELCVSASAHAQRRLACSAAQNLDEVGGVRESGAAPDLRRGHAIKERRSKHTDGEIDAGLDQTSPRRSHTPLALDAGSASTC
jgi:hypothetical protein